MSLTKQEAEEGAKMLSTGECQLISTLGVYGCWLVKNGINLPKDEHCVQNLMSVYKMYHKRSDHPTAGMLLGAVDCVVRDLDGFPLFNDYDTAVKDLMVHRGCDEETRKQKLREMSESKRRKADEQGSDFL